MDFSKEKAIYLQIADMIFESVLAGKWQEEERIPSTRDLAISLEVNPNTIMRTYGYLQENEIIFNRRGIGYFLAENARQRILQIKREAFIKKELPKFAKSLKLLEISFEELKKLLKS